MKNPLSDHSSISYLRSGNWQEAQRLVDLDHTLSRYDKAFLDATICIAQGSIGDGERLLKIAGSYPTAHPDVHINLANLLNGQGRYSEALPYAKRAYEMRPKDENFAMPYLTALLDSARVDEALTVITELTAKQHKSKKLLLAESACYRQKGDRDKALEILHRLSESHQKDPLVLRMLADTIGEIDSEKALPIYRTAIDLYGENAKSGNLHALRWNMSLHLLRTRSFDQGWPYYQSGLVRAVGSLSRKLPDQLYGIRVDDPFGPGSDGDTWKLVVVEQGIGDQVLFLSALRDALKEYGRIALVCEDRLAKIINRSFPRVVTIDPGILEFIDQLNFFGSTYIPVGNLFARYRNSLNEFIDRREPYLVVDREKYLARRTELKQKAAGRPIIGVSWKGGFWENQQRNKSMTLIDWRPVFKKNALFVNLQYGDVERECQELRNHGTELYTFPQIDFKKDLDSWLTIAAACDGIISVSTALVHFAGAIGQKVAMVLPEKQGPWIWGVSDKSSIVYKYVHIYRRMPAESLHDLMIRVSNVIQA